MNARKAPRIVAHNPDLEETARRVLEARKALGAEHAGRVFDQLMPRATAAHNKAVWARYQELVRETESFCEGLLAGVRGEAGEVVLEGSPMSALVDDRNYRAFCVVAGPWETERLALERAKRLASDWRELGRSVPSAVLYRDGSVVWGSLTTAIEAGEV